LRSKSQDLADFENGNEDDLGFGNNGLGLVFVARVVSNRFQVCTYLVDYWCLGVKDAIGPYDNSNMIVRTLEQKLGANNFDYMFPVDGLEDRSLDW